MTGSDASRRCLLVVADSDSYLKWGAALASTLPKEAWRTRVVVIASPVAPSARQTAAALAGSRFAVDDVPTVPYEELDALLDRLDPDAVLLALRGPFVRVVAPRLLRRRRRPVLLSGFPGLTIPAVQKAIVYREQTDLVVLHSRREVRDFIDLAERVGVRGHFGLATLPFLRARTGLARTGLKGAGPDPTDASSGTIATGLDIVFAAQAKVPVEREDRVRLLGWLAEHARRHPEHRVVVKVRARAGEAQTHAEAFDYADLVDEVDTPPNLVVADGPMGVQLARAGALVTVSSTAALEAVAAGVPVLLLDDFGISPEMINTVFAGSGLFGNADDLLAGRWRRADASWRRENYFHGTAADGWIPALEALTRARDAGPLPVLPRTRDRAGGVLRSAYDRRRMLGDFDRSVAGRSAMAIGRPTRWLVRRMRALRRWASGVPAGSVEGRAVLGDVAQVGVGVAADAGPLVVGEFATDLRRDAGDQ